DAGGGVDDAGAAEDGCTPSSAFSSVALRLLLGRLAAACFVLLRLGLGDARTRPRTLEREREREAARRGEREREGAERRGCFAALPVPRFLIVASAAALSVSLWPSRILSSSDCCPSRSAFRSAPSSSSSPSSCSSISIRLSESLASLSLSCAPASGRLRF